MSTSGLGGLSLLGCMTAIAQMNAARGVHALAQEDRVNPGRAECAVDLDHVPGGSPGAVDGGEHDHVQPARLGVGEPRQRGAVLLVAGDAPSSR